MQQGVRQACNLISLHQHLGSSSTRVKTLQLLGMRLLTDLYGPPQLPLEQCMAALAADRAAARVSAPTLSLRRTVVSCSCHEQRALPAICSACFVAPPLCSLLPSAAWCALSATDATQVLSALHAGRTSAAPACALAWQACSHQAQRGCVQAALGDAAALVDVILACCHAEVNRTSAAAIHRRLMLLSWRLQRAAALNSSAAC